MSDLISRAEVHKTLSLLATEGGTDAKMLLADAHEFIDALPSADTSSDLISRANAIRWVKTECNQYGKPTLDYDSGLKVIEHLKKMPSELPSTEAEWIPCSERLPSESGDYICTIPLDEEETYTEVLTFHKGRFYEDDDEWGATYHDDVLAWMPLPKPYREDKE